jgi:hypothetical protein
VVAVSASTAAAGATTAPPRATQAAALAAGVVAVATAAGGSLPAVAGVAGLAALAVGVVRGARGTTRVGGAMLVGTGAVAGVVDGSVAVALVATAAAVVAWDAAEYGLRLGEQVGRDAVTLRPQVLHVSGVASVCTVAAYFAHGVYGAAAAGRPSVLAVVLVVGGGFVLAAAVWLDG